MGVFANRPEFEPKPFRLPLYSEWCCTSVLPRTKKRLDGRFSLKLVFPTAMIGIISLNSYLVNR